jgi:hypothetical protein
MIKTIVEGANQLGISKIILGRLRGVRNKAATTVKQMP